MTELAVEPMPQDAPGREPRPGGAPASNAAAPDRPTRPSGRLRRAAADLLEGLPDE